MPANRLIPFRVRNASDRTIHFHPGTAPGKFYSLDQETTVTSVNALQPSEGPKDHFNLATSTLSTDEQTKLAQLLDQNRDIFVISSQELGRTSIVQHIDTGDTQPIRQQPYRVGPETQKEINSQVQEMLS